MTYRNQCRGRKRRTQPKARARRLQWLRAFPYEPLPAEFYDLTSSVLFAGVDARGRLVVL